MYEVTTPCACPFSDRYSVVSRFSRHLLSHSNLKTVFYSRPPLRLSLHIPLSSSHASALMRLILISVYTLNVLFCKKERRGKKMNDSRGGVWLRKLLPSLYHILPYFFLSFFVCFVVSPSCETLTFSLHLLHSVCLTCTPLSTRVYFRLFFSSSFF
jgi:hypothetical protein